MLHPLTRLLPAVKPMATGPLVSENAWERIDSVARRLPVWFGYFGFECRLQPGCDRVDVLMATTRELDGLRAVAASLEQGDDLDCFEPYRALLSVWTEEGSDLEREVPLVNFEFDLPDVEVRTPSAYLCVYKDYLREASGDPHDPEALIRLAREALFLTTGQHPDPEHLGVLDRCSRAFAPNGKIVHLGRRDASGIRAIAGVPRCQLRSALQAIGWEGDAAKLERTLELLGHTRHHDSVQFDVGSRVGPKLAFEFYLPTTEVTEPVVQFIDRLVSAGICDPVKGRAALSWIGRRSHILPGAAWRVDIQRHLDVKLTLHADGTIEAKAYLGFHPRYVLV